MIFIVKMIRSSGDSVETLSEKEESCTISGNSDPALMGGEKVIRKGIGSVWRKSAAAVLVLALTAGMWGCGADKKEQETAHTETASAQTTLQEPINPEEVKSEDIIKEEVKEEEKPEAAEAETEAEKEVIEKPEPSGETDQSQEKKGKKKNENSENKAADLGEVLDGHMVFDGMDLQFPIELSGMKLGNWTITYELEGDPSDKTLAYQEVVMAKMTNPNYTDNDVIVRAEFGNYTGSEAALTDLPLTGIYVTRGKGTDSAEPRLPSLELPCGFTWGTSQSEIQQQLGEPSLSGSFDYEFDLMYENGQYLIELAGMGDSGLEYVVYSVE